MRRTLEHQSFDPQPKAPCRSGILWARRTSHPGPDIKPPAQIAIWVDTARTLPQLSPKSRFGRDISLRRGRDVVGGPPSRGSSRLRAPSRAPGDPIRDLGEGPGGARRREQDPDRRPFSTPCVISAAMSPKSRFGRPPGRRSRAARGRCAQGWACRHGARPIRDLGHGLAPKSRFGRRGGRGRQAMARRTRGALQPHELGRLGLVRLGGPGALGTLAPVG